MQSPDSASEIELDDLPSISERLPRNPSKSGHNYLPQDDEEEDSHTESQPQESLYTKISKNKAVNYPILFILCIAILDLPILTALAYKYFTQDTFKSAMQTSLLKPLQFMSANLKADPIIDVRLGYTGPCPIDYQIVKLAIWPGSVSGCLCDNGDFYRTSCAEVDSEQCKTELPSSYGTSLYEWEMWYWCTKRAAEGVDYVKKAECPSNYKECYPGGCFKEDCPVTGIVSPITKLMNETFASVLLNRIQGKPPLINFMQTLGETSCDIREAECYKSSADAENLCDKYGLNKQVMTQIATQTAYTAYFDNAFPYSVMKLHDFVGNEMATSSVLSSVSRMKTARNDYCLNIDEKAINNFLELIPNKIDLVCLVLVSVLQLGNLLNVAWNLAPNSKTKLFKNSSRVIKAMYILNIFIFIVVIIALGNFAYVYSQIHAARGYLKEYNSLGCFSGNAGERVIYDYLGILDTVDIGSWLYLVLFVMKIGSGLLCLRIYTVEENKTSQEIKKLKQKNSKPASLKNVLSEFQ